MNIFNLFKMKKQDPTVVERTNKIQYDCMGYPLRLVKMSDGKYRWLDSYEEDGDVLLSPNEVLSLNEELF